MPTFNFCQSGLDIDDDIEQKCHTRNYYDACTKKQTEHGFCKEWLPNAYIVKSLIEKELAKYPDQMEYENL